MVRLPEQVQHHGPWTEVERHTLADMEVRMGRQCQLRETTPLDVGHPDDRAALRSSPHLRIAEQAVRRDDRRKAIDVHDVIDLRLLWNQHRQSSVRRVSIRRTRWHRSIVWLRLPRDAPAIRGAAPLRNPSSSPSGDCIPCPMPTAVFGPTPPPRRVHREIADKCLHPFGRNGSSETGGGSEQSKGPLESRDVQDTHRAHA